MTGRVYWPKQLRSKIVPRQTAIPDVKPVKLESYAPSADGEMIVLMVKDRAGNQGWIGLDWHDVSGALALIQQGSRAAKEVRAKLGKTDTLKENQTKTFFMVAGHEVGEHSQGALKILALHAANGLRFDFAMSADMPDPGGSAMTLPEAIGTHLIGSGPKRRPRVQ
jgi:hypothetical protein